MADIISRVWAIKQFTFNSITYDEDNGGPLSWNFDDSSNEIGDRVADQVYVSAILIPERELRLTITMRDPYTAITPATKGDLVLTLKSDSGVVDQTLTYKNMLYLSQGASGQKSVPAESTLSFRHEASGAARQTGTSRITRT